MGGRSGGTPLLAVGNRRPATVNLRRRRGPPMTLDQIVAICTIVGTVIAIAKAIISHGFQRILAISVGVVLIGAAIFFVVRLLVPLPSSPLPTPKTSAEWCAQGDQHAARKEWDQAVSAYTEALAL